MASGPLNDEVVLSEMNKMFDIFLHFSLEKARELKVKADEEFAIDKVRRTHHLVKQEEQTIDAQFEKKRKGAERAQNNHQSTLTNKSQLRLSHRREVYLQDLFAAARTQIARLAEHEVRYVQFLESVIVQGLLQPFKRSATVYARSKEGAIASRGQGLDYQ
ncbi:hypothetical protein F5888DRAFT_1622243 [Russula emetica]|nr:hypothetical protein F5888DRAFT_1622243 [Russula emetica]